MKIEQKVFDGYQWTTRQTDISSPDSVNLVLVFAARSFLEKPETGRSIQKEYVNAECLFCSTSGEIVSTQVLENTVAVTAIEFSSTRIATALINRADFENSLAAGRFLAEQFPQQNLKHLFVLSDGQKVNASALVEGMNSVLPDHVAVTGGLAGDSAQFQKTLVGLNDNIREGNIVAAAFYGEHIKIGFGSRGGWDAFGPERLITRSRDNVLYELDGRSALALYKNYLGAKADGLPGTALLFPLTIKVPRSSEPLVRTILSIDEQEGSMTFAGDMPMGAYARLMKANFERLIDGASLAAENSLTRVSDPDLAILISCVGRKLILGQRTEEEAESVREMLGTAVVMAGFYSNGEIAPFAHSLKCELHNQTMTISTFKEN
jgi:hypothetical protein